MAVSPFAIYCLANGLYCLAKGYESSIFEIENYIKL